MTIVWCSNYEELSRKAAAIIASQIIIKPTSTIGFATGSTPIGLYANLVKKYQNKEISFANVKAFNLDEYITGSREVGWSFSSFMQTHLFSHVDIPEENTDIPNGVAEDLEVECARYSEALSEVPGGLDYQILGIGTNGHIGFVEPNEFYPLDTHIVDLAESSIIGQRPFFEDWSKIPTRALTVGIRPIMHAKQLLLIASGPEKSEILQKALFGVVTSKVPASILQLHKNLTVVADKEALADILANNPECSL
ncbi:MAG: glucosamine-6-phosphate deaminase [Oscillospiraceae bacterium]|nr:glucosamine-6-phosphate deaminase [Oscillospiraceae bacterium]